MATVEVDLEVFKVMRIATHSIRMQWCNRVDWDREQGADDTDSRSKADYFFEAMAAADEIYETATRDMS